AELAYGVGQTLAVPVVVGFTTSMFARRFPTGTSVSAPPAHFEKGQHLTSAHAVIAQQQDVLNGIRIKMVVGGLVYDRRFHQTSDTGERRIVNLQHPASRL